jgi:hypothetical protein
VTHDHSPPLAVMMERKHASKLFVINPALVRLIASEHFTTFIYHKNLKILYILPSRSVQKLYSHLITDLSLSVHNLVILLVKEVWLESMIHSCCYCSCLFMEEVIWFLILNFCRVLIVVSFLLGKSPASVYYCMLTFRNSLSVPSSKAMVVFCHCLRRWNR